MMSDEDCTGPFADDCPVHPHPRHAARASLVAERDAARADVSRLEVEAACAEYRSKLVLEAKDAWADRARQAEADVQRLTVVLEACDKGTYPRGKLVVCKECGWHLRSKNLQCRSCIARAALEPTSPPTCGDKTTSPIRYCSDACFRAERHVPHESDGCPRFCSYPDTRDVSLCPCEGDDCAVCEAARKRGELPDPTPSRPGVCFCANGPTESVPGANVCAMCRRPYPNYDDDDPPGPSGQPPKEEP